MVSGTHTLRTWERWGTSDYLDPTEESTTDHTFSVSSSDNTEDEPKLITCENNKQNQHSSEICNRIQSFTHNVQNVHDKVQHYLTYQKYDAFQGKVLVPEVVFTQTYLTLRPMDCSLSGSSVHGILQVKILEWVAISFSRESSWPGDQTQVFNIAGRFFTLWATREKTLDRWKLQDALNVGIIMQNFAVAFITSITEVKLNTSWDE